MISKSRIHALFDHMMDTTTIIKRRDGEVRASGVMRGLKRTAG